MDVANLPASAWLKTIEEHAKNAGDGKWLEALVCDLGNRIPEWDFEKVLKWEDWAEREKHFPHSSKQDVGIDNVGIKRNGSVIAIQCKARSGNSELTVDDLGRFAASAAEDIWSGRWVISNAQFSRGIHEINARSESRPFKLVNFVEPVRDLALEESIGVKDDGSLTEMQNEVVAQILKLMPLHAEKGREKWNPGEARGHIVLPCGTGKTRIAYRVMKGLVQKGEIAIVLVPSIALVSQIKREFQKLAHRDGLSLRTLAICSDKTAGRTTVRGKFKLEDSVNLERDPTIDTSHVHSYEVAGDTAINEDQVIKWVREALKNNDNDVLALFSTYQSSHNTATALTKLDLKAKLLIADEAHRTAGIKKIPKNGERFRNFTLCHDKDRFPAMYRLYQTATPRVYTKSNIQKSLHDLDDSNWDVRSMNDIDTFGIELYRMSYVEAVERDLLSDYRIIAWGISEYEAAEAQKIAEKLNAREGEDTENDTRWNPTMAIRALTLASFLAGCVPETQVRSVIAFSNRIKMSSDMARAVQTEPVQEWLRGYFKRLELKLPPNDFKVEHIDATYSSARRSDALHNLATASATSPFCISNVGIFGEGTDSPDLSAVAFLNPRKSPVDVIQAVGRAMRKSSNKEFGYILVPVVIPRDRDPEIFLRNSDPEHGWEELGQILQALRAHDGRIEDHLESLMEFYAPSPNHNELVNHIVVVQEPYKKVEVYKLETVTQVIESVVIPNDEEDKSSIRDRLERHKGKLEVVHDASELSATELPRTLSAVVTDRDGKTLIKDLTYAYLPKDAEIESETKWSPEEAISKAKSFIKRDKRSRKTKMRPLKPVKKKKSIDRQRELGMKLIHLEGNALRETGVHLNLLAKSGIQGGPKRDSNLLRGTVNAVSRFLHRENLEEVLSIRLGMEHMENQSSSSADACTVTAVIWVNAAIMHARLERSGLRQLKGVPSLESCISHVTPALGLMEAWRKVLIEDYVPIFEIAYELLQDVAFEGYECVSDALRLLAKNASDIAENYANLGMDHAGELFNSVMGNQRSDGAFFTKPIAATMLAELCLNSIEPFDWTNESLWSELRTFDPACGSGTILVAMMSAIKRRIKLSGGNEQKVKKFHRYAVEHLLIGADINPVSLQLAACQLTLGDMSVSYENINLHRMEYGEVDRTWNSDSVKTGSIELLLDSRLVPKTSELLESHSSEGTLRIDMIHGTHETSLGDELVDKPPKFVLMNPPYTNWRAFGEKFSNEIHIKLRNRVSEIWSQLAQSYTILGSGKSTIAPLFELLATTLSQKSSGVMGFVRAATVISAMDAKPFRKRLAATAHVDCILMCFDPNNINLSWDTGINECLIIMSQFSKDDKRPTQFINVNKFPETVDEVHDLLDAALRGEVFNGSRILWDYDLMLQGDWSPAVFADCSLAKLLHDALDETNHLRYDLVGSSNHTSIDSEKSMKGGGGWHAGRFDI